MSETVLQAYAAAVGAPVNEPTAPSKGSVGLYIAFQFPHRNDELDPQGFPQPITPPVEIAYIETRFTYDDRAEDDPENEEIVWTKHQKNLCLGPTAKLQDPNEPFDISTNDWEGLKGQIAIRPLLIKENIFFQCRCVTRSGIPSDWTKSVKLAIENLDDEEQSSLSNMACREDSVTFIPANTV